MARRFWVAFIAICLGASDPLLAQDLANLPDDAGNLVVRVLVHSDSGEFLQGGAGVIISAKNKILIATAAHVVGAAERGARVTVVFRFARQDTIVAGLEKIDHETRDGVALISTPIPPHAPRFSFDRLGDSRALRNGDDVFPVGCPHGVCWEPGSPDRFIRIYELGLIFESFVTEPGTSGGALFNRNWEVVGIVTAKSDPQGRALQMDRILRQVRAWKYPVSLSRRAMPRAGYSTTLAMLALAPGKGDAVEKGRWPGGRATLTFRSNRTFGWHVAALRLAPTHMAVTGGVVGGDLRLRAGRLTFAPFLDIGAARVEGQYDAGGFVVQGPNGPESQAIWRETRADVLGFGVGSSLQFAIVPHVLLEVVGGHWNFRPPDELRQLPNLFFGGGLAFGF